MRDSLFIGHQPYFGGDSDRLRQILEEVSRLAPKLLVPGHGLVGTAESVRVMAKALDGLNTAQRTSTARALDEKALA